MPSILHPLAKPSPFLGRGVALSLSLIYLSLSVTEALVRGISKLTNHKNASSGVPPQPANHLACPHGGRETFLHRRRGRCRVHVQDSGAKTGKNCFEATITSLVASFCAVWARLVCTVVVLLRRPRPRPLEKYSDGKLPDIYVGAVGTHVFTLHIRSTAVPGSAI